MSLLVGFSLGFYFKKNESIEQTEYTDNILQSILSSLAIVQSSSLPLSDDTKQLINIEIERNLNQIRQRQSIKLIPELEKAKVITLNYVFLFWKKKSPFSDEWQKSVSNQFWYNDWKNDHMSNIKLLQWAYNECQKDLNLDCKTINN